MTPLYIITHSFWLNLGIVLRAKSSNLKYSMKFSEIFRVAAKWLDNNVKIDEKLTFILDHPPPSDSYLNHNMFYPDLQNQRVDAVYSCCCLVLYSILLLNIVCLLHFYLCHISMYAFRAPRRMSFGLLGSPSENKMVIIIIIIT